MRLPPAPVLALFALTGILYALHQLTRLDILYVYATILAVFDILFLAALALAAITILLSRLAEKIRRRLKAGKPRENPPP